MINAITVTNYLGESIKMELRYPEKSGFAILRMDGLGPGKATINSTETSAMDGAVYNSAKLNVRNILLKLKFLSKPDVETARQLTYKYFPVKKYVKLRIESDHRECEVTGYVESNEPNIFDVFTGTDISILCHDPYLYSTDMSITVFSGIQSLFEFPFSNESLVNPMIMFSSIQNDSVQTVLYEGDAEVGIRIIIKAMGEVNNLTIYNLNTRETMKISSSRLAALTGSDIIAGDEIFISTVKGNKYIQLLRDGEYINILNCLDKNVDWFYLSKGDNLFGYTADYGTTNLQFRIENRIAYEGV